MTENKTHNNNYVYVFYHFSPMGPSFGTIKLKKCKLPPDFMRK